MLEISLFLPLHPTKFNEKLKRLGFQADKQKSMRMLFDEKEIRIRPLANQYDFEKTFGYRIQTNLRVDVIVYVLDMVLKDLDIVVTGILEKIEAITLTTRQTEALQLSKTDYPYIYQKGDTSVMFQPSLERIYIQQRAIRCRSLAEFIKRMKKVEQLHVRCLDLSRNLFTKEMNAS